MTYRACFIVALAVLALSFIPSSAHAEAQLGTLMPEFELQALDNRFYGTKGAQGKISILFFMGHNCDPCIGAGPAVEANIYQKVREKPTVQMMGLDVWNGNIGELALFRTITGVTFPLLKTAAQENIDYAGAALEDLVVIDQNGFVRLSIDSASESDHFKVTDMVDALLNTTPIIELSLRNIYYGTTMSLGDTKILNMNIQNTGAGALDITGMTTTIPGLTMAPPNVNIAAFGTETVKIIFNPEEAGDYSGALTLDHNNSAVQVLQLSFQNITVEGSLDPSITLAQQNLAIGEIEVGKSATQTVTITNGGPGPLEVSNMQSVLSGLTFSETAFIVNAGESKDITVTIAPQTGGELAGTIDILSNDPTNGTMSITLSGSAIIVPADPRTDFDGSGAVDFPDFLAFVQVFGTASTTHDLDGSGAVDFGDFLTFVANFGKTVTP